MEEDITPIWEYSPKTIGQALRLMNVAYTEQESLREVMSECENAEEFSARMHFGAGRTMRNRWRLWVGLMHNQDQETSDGEIPDPSPLHDHIAASTGITHPDDQSGFLLELFYNDIHNPEKTLGEIAWKLMKEFHDHWTKKYDAPEWSPINNIRE